MGDDGRRRPHWFLNTLAWWTLAGTCLSVVGLFTDVPRSGILWPTAIRPAWLGVVIGGAVFLILARIIGVMRRSDPATEEVRAARSDVAAVLRAYAAKRQTGD